LQGLALQIAPQRAPQKKLLDKNPNPDFQIPPSFLPGHIKIPPSFLPGHITKKSSQLFARPHRNVAGQKAGSIYIYVKLLSAFCPVTLLPNSSQGFLPGHIMIGRIHSDVIITVVQSARIADFRENSTIFLLQEALNKSIKFKCNNFANKRRSA